MIINNDNKFEEKNLNKNIYVDNIYIYSWGKNTYGELGNYSNNNCYVPTPCLSLKNIEAYKISSAGKHTLLISKNYEIYSCGSSQFGVLGNSIENNKFYYPNFEKINTFEDEKIIDLSCGEFHSLALTNDNFLCSWGGNKSHKLGQINYTGKPQIITDICCKKVVNISCGDYHSVILTSEKEIYSWGGGEQYNHGQCGLGTFKDISIPTKIMFFEGKFPKKISCGAYHTIVLCDNDKLYSFGKGDLGQLGNGSQEDSNVPKEFKINLEKNIDKIMDIKCGSEHNAILMKSGDLYMFGHNYNGQLGLGDNFNYFIPTYVKSLKNIVISKIALGWSHTLILTKDNYLYSSGCNINGELGIDDFKLFSSYNSKYNFTLILEASKLNIEDIFCGGHHSWITINKNNPIKSNFILPKKLFFEKKKEEIYNNNYINIKEKNGLYKKVLKSSLKYNLNNLLNDENNNIININSIKYLLIIIESNFFINKRYIKIYFDINKNFEKLKNKLKNFVQNSFQILSFEIIKLENFIENDFFKDNNLKDIKNIKDIFFEEKEIPKNNSNEFIICFFMLNKKLYDEKKNKEYIKNFNYNIQYLDLNNVKKDFDEKNKWVFEFINVFKKFIIFDEINNIFPKFIEFRQFDLIN